MSELQSVQVHLKELPDDLAHRVTLVYNYLVRLKEQQMKKGQTWAYQEKQKKQLEGFYRAYRKEGKYHDPIDYESSDYKYNAKLYHVNWNYEADVFYYRVGTGKSEPHCSFDVIVEGKKLKLTEIEMTPTGELAYHTKIAKPLDKLHVLWIQSEEEFILDKSESEPLPEFENLTFNKSLEPDRAIYNNAQLNIKSTEWEYPSKINGKSIVIHTSHLEFEYYKMWYELDGKFHFRFLRKVNGSEETFDFRVNFKKFVKLEVREFIKQTPEEDKIAHLLLKNVKMNANSLINAVTEGILPYQLSDSFKNLMKQIEDNRINSHFEINEIETALGIDARTIKEIIL